MRQTRKVFIPILLVLVVVALFFTFCCKIMPSKLSELNDEDLIQYLTDGGFEFLDGQSARIDRIREGIIELENDPDHPAPSANYYKIIEQYEITRKLVVEYKNIANKWILFGRFVVG